MLSTYKQSSCYNFCYQPQLSITTFRLPFVRGYWYTEHITTMGLSLSTARWVAPASFAYDFALQQYGLLHKPTMKDVHDANLSFWSPNPYFIGAFFFPQQIAQLVWMYKLWKLDEKKPAEAKELAEIKKFVPVYALGNVCIGSEYYRTPVPINYGRLTSFHSLDVLLEQQPS